MNDPLLPTPASALALIHARRTVKPPLYAERDIEPPVLESILEAATWAPTHGMNEPWRFRAYVAEGRARLGETLVELYDGLVPPEERREDKRQALRDNARACAAGIAVFADRARPGKIPLIEDIEAVACAVQNLQLAARAHGIGAFWSTNTVDYTTPPRQGFPGVPATWLYLGVVFLGYPRAGFPHSSRRPLASAVEWIRD